MNCRWMIVLLCMGLLAGAHSAMADIKYFKDPVYKKLNDEDHHPMDDMLDMAKQGDPRAQFILGDMYSKGKGGLPQDLKESRRWFEESAMHGDNYGFIRLAALAKKDKNYLEAWQWYTLGLDGYDTDDEEKFLVQARRALVEASGLTPEDIRHGRKNISDWKSARSDKLRAEREQARRQQEEAEKAARAEKEKSEKEKAEKDKLAATAQEEKKDGKN